MNTVNYVSKQAVKQEQGIIVGDAWVTDNPKAPVRIQFRTGYDKVAKQNTEMVHAIPGGSYASVVIRKADPKRSAKAPNAVVILDASAA